MELKDLFLVSENDGKPFVVSQKTIDYRKKWHYHTTLTVVEELGPIWAKNATVEKTESGGGRCWVWQNYKITADEKLNERDMEVIRAQYPFLEGQDTAKVDLQSFQEVEGKFVYKAHSECDSGD
jgi:hypothetical protein